MSYVKEEDPVPMLQLKSTKLQLRRTRMLQLSRIDVICSS